MRTSHDNQAEGADVETAGTRSFAGVPGGLRQDLERRWTQLSRAHPAAAEAVTSDAALSEQLSSVRATSEFVAETCLRHPGEFAALCATGRLSAPWRDGQLVEAGDGLLAGIEDEAGAMAALRGLRRRERCCASPGGTSRGLASLEETLGHLSGLAAVSIRAAADWAHARLAESHGEPRALAGEPQRMLVIAMGKLGGGEVTAVSRERRPGGASVTTMRQHLASLRAGRRKRRRFSSFYSDA